MVDIAMEICYDTAIQLALLYEDIHLIVARKENEHRKKITRRFLAMLLASLMLVSALPVYAAGEEAPAQDDPWMDYAREHLGNTLPFMREEELSFLEPGCQVYLGNRLSAYNSQLGQLPYAMYPVFVDGQVVAIATVSEDENGEFSFQAGPDFAEQLNEFIADNANVALVVNEGSIQFINDEGETETLSYFEDSAAPAALSLTPDVECSQAVPVTAIQEVPKSRAYGEDSGIVGVKYVPQGKDELCWAACMASVVNYYQGKSYTARSLADYIKKPYNGAEMTPRSCMFYYNNWFNMDSEVIHTALSYDFVYNEAHAGKPIHAALYAKTGEGHAVLVRGCYYSNSVVYYRIMDPNVGLTIVQMNSNGAFTLSFNGRKYNQEHYIMFH